MLKTNWKENVKVERNVVYKEWEFKRGECVYGGGREGIMLILRSSIKEFFPYYKINHSS